MVAREVPGVLTNILGSAYRRLRRSLRRVRYLRSTWYLCLTVKQSLLDTPERARSKFDSELRRQTDPWGYSRPCHQERFQRALSLLDGVRGGMRFRQGFEIGCGEGWFTELLAERCESLLAVDFSCVALARARVRCQRYKHLQFVAWDLRQGFLPKAFDLVIIMDVLECLNRRSDLLAVGNKLVDLIAPSGYLLVTTTRASDVVENAWWGRWLIRGRHINAFIAEIKPLIVCATANTDTHAMTLYRRIPER